MVRLFFCTFLFLINSYLSKADSKLSLYAWSDSIPASIVKQFYDETGIKVTVSTYENNEMMYAKLKLLKNQTSYDIVFPSTYFIKKMRDSDMLDVINLNKIPNFNFIQKDVLGLSFDPKNKYSIPYATYFTGISYNKKYVKDNIKDWNDLFSNKYKNKILLLDDMREVFHVAFILLGLDPNSVSENGIKSAYEKLVELLPNIRLFSAESTKNPFLSEEVVIGMNWNADAYQAMLENKDLEFIFPIKGSLFSMDNFSILKNAKNKDNAHKFINFIHRPDIAKKIIMESMIGIPNIEAQKLLPEKVNILFPSSTIIERSIVSNSLSEKSISIYEKYWEMLKLKN